MNSRSRIVLVISLCLVSALLTAQQGKAGLLTADELKKAVPSSYFFAGQSASVQMRNSAGFRTADGKLVLAGLVDNSGYASDIAAKYQGFLILEVKLNLEGSDLPAGAYGFGFTKDGKFIVTDLGNRDVISTNSKMEDDMKRPVPLKIAGADGGYRLYAGKKWVSLKLQ